MTNKKPIFLKSLKGEEGKPFEIHGEQALEIVSHLLETNQVNEEILRSVVATLYPETQSTQLPNNSISASIVAPASTVLAQQEPPTVRKRHIALQIYYDGSKYTGLAENVGVEHDQSVEKALFRALRQAYLIDGRSSCQYSRCGRTDKGVSAAGQVVALQLKSAISLQASWDEAGQRLLNTDELPKNAVDALQLWVPPRKPSAPKQLRTVREYAYDRVLNNLLPSDIQVLGWVPVDDAFSARFSCRDRTYRYFFHSESMDLERMRDAMTLLLGEHDFRNFCKMDVEKVYNFKRVIHQAIIVEKEPPASGVCYFQIQGQAFLWHQIRCIASILFSIGRGYESPTLISELLDVKKYPGKPAYPLAPERPLVLHNCGFGHLQFGYTVANLWSVYETQKEQWKELILTAARIQNLLETIESLTVRTDDLQAFYLEKKRVQSKKNNKRYFANLTNEIAAVPSERMISWKQAMEWLQQNGQIMNNTETHIPMADRSMGTTYEEKLQALQASDRKRQRYETNVMQKRKSKQEDEQFYAEMTQRGGSAL
jgi:tRNA pseudouridine38/39 synthase